MRKFFLSLSFIIFVLGVASYYYYLKTGNLFGLDKTIFSNGTSFISSSEIANGGQIPITETCDWKNVSPSLIFDRIPSDAKSLAVVVEDVTTKPKPFTHYLLFNINPTTLEIQSDQVPDEAIVGTNDFGNSKYEGPCPPQGETHDYYFKLYTLDKILDLSDMSKRPDFDKAIEGHVLSKGSFHGLYTRVAN